MAREAREREEAAKKRTEEEIKNEKERQERVRMERSLFDDFYKSVCLACELILSEARRS